jgi:hypothetical protein
MIALLKPIFYKVDKELQFILVIDNPPMPVCHKLGPNKNVNEIKNMPTWPTWPHFWGAAP